MKAAKANARMEKALALARQRLRLPSEIYLDVDEPAAEQFLQQIAAPSDSSGVIALSHSLTHKELKQVFPALLSDRIADKKLFDRLLLVIRERACTTLYHHGWLILQQNPDNFAVQKALAILCSILEIKRSTTCNSAESSAENNAVSEKFKVSSSAGNHKGELPLISCLTSPGHRQFIKRLSLVLSNRRIDLRSFYAQFGVLPDSQLAVDLSSQVFLSRQHYTSADKGLFRRSLKEASDPVRSELVQSFLSTSDLPQAIVHDYCEMIFQTFGSPDEGNPIWQPVRERERTVFTRWMMHDAVLRHCQPNPKKRDFYLRYLDTVRRIEFRDDKTLLIYFDSFVLADHRDDTDAAMYYGHGEASEHPYGLAESDPSRNPASAAVPHRSCEEAIRKGDSSGVVRLYFNESAIRESGAFLDFCLQSTRGSISGLRRRYLN